MGLSGLITDGKSCVVPVLVISNGGHVSKAYRLTFGLFKTLKIV